MIHRSFPNNPIIADPLFYTRHIDKIWTGLTDLIDECREAGLPDPKIEVGETTYMITIYRSVPVNVPVNVPVKIDVKDRIVDVVANNPGINRKKLAQIFELTEKTIGRYVKSLRDAIEFRGAPKTGGYYVIVQSNNLKS